MVYKNNHKNDHYFMNYNDNDKIGIRKSVIILLVYEF